jgi:hypothetical protein
MELEDRGIRVRLSVGARGFSLLHSILIGSEAHPVSYPMGIGGSFRGDKADRAWSWSFISTQRLRTSSRIPPDADTSPCSVPWLRIETISVLLSHVWIKEQILAVTQWYSRTTDRTALPWLRVISWEHIWYSKYGSHCQHGISLITLVVAMINCSADFKWNQSSIRRSAAHAAACI